MENEMKKGVWDYHWALIEAVSEFRDWQIDCDEYVYNYALRNGPEVNYCGEPWNPPSFDNTKLMKALANAEKHMKRACEEQTKKAINPS